MLQCQLLLPFWNEPALPFDDSLVPDWSGLRVETGLKGEITMPDGSNMRSSLVTIMERLQEKLFEKAEDDTMSCCILVDVSTL